MSTDVADVTKAEEASNKKRGGQRGERPWRDKPTARERVMNQDLANFIKGETGKDVSPETIRAVRFTITKWTKADSTIKLRGDMDVKLAKAKLQDKREKALASLREAESELSKFDSDGDLDDDDAEDEDDVEDTDSDSEDDDDDDGIFSDSPEGDKVSASFG